MFSLGQKERTQTFRGTSVLLALWLAREAAYEGAPRGTGWLPRLQQCSLGPSALWPALAVAFQESFPLNTGRQVGASGTCPPSSRHSMRLPKTFSVTTDGKLRLDSYF